MHRESGQDVKHFPGWTKKVEKFPGSFLQKTMVLLIQARANFWPLFVAPSVERLDLLLLGIHGLCLRHHNLLRRVTLQAQQLQLFILIWSNGGQIRSYVILFAKVGSVSETYMTNIYIYINCNLHLHVVCGWNWVYSLAWRLSRPNCIRKWRSKNDAFPDVECLCERIHRDTETIWVSSLAASIGYRCCGNLEDTSGFHSIQSIFSH